MAGRRRLHRPARGAAGRGSGRRPTDLPGWDVHAVAAHTAHLEAVLAGAPEDPLTAAEGGHVRGHDGRLHRVGRPRPARPHARRAPQRDPRVGHRAAHRPARRPAHRRLGRPGADVHRRHLVLGDAAAQPPAGRVDARAGRPPRGRTPRRPGHPRAPARRRLPRREPGLVLAKRVGARRRAPPPCSRSTAARRRRSGSPTRGRGDGSPEVPADPTVRLAMDRETFVAARRRPPRPAPGAVRVTGDQELGAAAARPPRGHR